jgi:cellobiose phosphorylase
LYALRGVLAAGETDKALSFLHYYSNRRLLGEHVPYPVEAYPEGSQRQLSAESGLYCRIFTEGLFGIRPTGLHSFSFTPRLPLSWPIMSLRHIRAFERDFDIVVERVDGKRKVTVSDGEKILVNKLIKEGDMIKVNLFH